MKLGLRCKTCNQRLLSAYISDQTKKTRMKKIGLFCVNCDMIRAPTQFLKDKKQEVKSKMTDESNKRIKTPSKPTFSRYTEICMNPECKSKRIKIVKRSEKIKIDFDKVMQEWTVNQNNPTNECTCKKCGSYWTVGLPIPREPHYLVPAKINKSKLHLILQRIPRNQLSIPKNLNSLVKEIYEELEKKS